MDLNKIHYFFKAVELNNFTEAAKQCHIAQTTMSKYISVLEQELNIQLFIRHHNGPILTSQGKQFYDGMKEIVSHYQNLCQSIVKDIHNELYIGILTTDYTDFKIIQSFEKMYSHISIHFIFGEEKKLLEDLQLHKIDALISPNMLKFYYDIKEQLESLTLANIEVAIVCSKELIEQYHSIEQVIQNVPFITKAKEEDYHSFCKEEIQKFYHTTFDKTTIVKEFPEQLLLLNLSRGFSILPITKINTQDHLISFPIPDIFNETAKLIFLKDNDTPNLKLLTQHIHEQKC